jgi:endonuclease III
LTSPNSVDTVSEVIATLHAAYGSPDHGNFTEPLDELVYILLSQMTTHLSYRRVFSRLKAATPSWSLVLAGGVQPLRALIADAGLSTQKATRILAILERLVDDFGAVTLWPPLRT